MTEGYKAIEIITKQGKKIISEHAYFSLQSYIECVIDCAKDGFLSFDTRDGAVSVRASEIASVRELPAKSQ